MCGSLPEIDKSASLAAPQLRISKTNHLHPGLAFDSYLTKCLVTLNLKCGEPTHQAIGQMDM